MTKPEHPKSAAGPAVSAAGKQSLPEIALQGLSLPLREAVERAGWRELTAVQAKAIPFVLAGRDLIVQSRTGSGKTAAFLLPILERLDPKSPTCQALVLVPTRELARQVTGDSETLFHGTEVRTVPLYGGVGYGAQLEGLRKGAHLVVGTPGRILDHLVRGTLSLEDLEILVFDEADRMLSMGFYPDMKELSRYLPDDRDGFMFSATYPAVVRSLARQFLRDPEFLSLSHGHEHILETEHVYYEIPAMEKDRALVRIIEIENPVSAIVFCNTKATAHYVGVVLQRFGYDAAELTADLSQKERDRVLSQAYERTLRFLVATDLAGRGIDIRELSHVILYDFPEDPESYIHRTGRTGRAGASGEAISLVDRLELLELRSVSRKYGIDFERRTLPSDADVQAIVGERVTVLLEAKLRHLDRLVRERTDRMKPLAKSLAEGDEERAIIAMLLDEYYQKSLHAPALVPVVEPVETGSEAKTPKKGRSRRGRGRGR